MPTEVIYRPNHLNPPSNASAIYSHNRRRVKLVPGSNLDIPAEDLAVISESPDWKRAVALGAIKVAEAAEVVDLEPPAASIAHLNEEMVEDLVDGIHDATVLEGYLKSEKRRNIRNIINRRLTSIKGGNA